MRQRKRVTEKQRAANRRNATRSTGPRTERGKGITRLNALTHGLTAGLDQIVSRVDGYSRDEFRDLVGKLYEQLRPVGVLEGECVDEIVHALLIRRRAKRFESARIAQAANGDTAPIEENPMLHTAREELTLLNAALAEIANQGTVPSLPHETVQIVSHLMRNEGGRNAEMLAGDLTRVVVDNTFVKSLRAVARGTENFIAQLVQRDEENVSNYYRSKSLVSEADMKLLIMAEDRAFKKMNRALLRLEHLQRSRANAENVGDELPFPAMKAGNASGSEVM